MNTDKLIHQVATSLFPDRASKDLPTQEKLAHALSDRDGYIATESGAKLMRLIAKCTECPDDNPPWPNEEFASAGVLVWVVKEPSVLVHPLPPAGTALPTQMLSFTLREMMKMCWDWQEENEPDDFTNPLALLIRGWDEWCNSKPVSRVDGGVEVSASHHLTQVPKVMDSVFAAMRCTNLDAYTTPDGFSMSLLRSASEMEVPQGKRPPNSTPNLRTRTSQLIKNVAGTHLNINAMTMNPTFFIRRAAMETYPSGYFMDEKLIGNIIHLAHYGLACRRPIILPLSYFTRLLLGDRKDMKSHLRYHRNSTADSLDHLQMLGIRVVDGGVLHWLLNLDIIDKETPSKDPLYSIGRSAWLQKDMMDNKGNPQALHLSDRLFRWRPHPQQMYMYDTFFDVAEAVVSNSGAPTRMKNGRSVCTYLHPDNADSWITFTYRDWATLCGWTWTDPLEDCTIYHKANKIRTYILDTQGQYPTYIPSIEWAMPSSDEDARAIFAKFRATASFRDAHTLHKNDLLRIESPDHILTLRGAKPITASKPKRKRRRAKAS